MNRYRAGYVYYWIQNRMARCAWEYLRGTDYSGMISKNPRCIEAMNDMNYYYLKLKNMETKLCHG